MPSPPCTCAHYDRVRIPHGLHLVPDTCRKRFPFWRNSEKRASLLSNSRTMASSNTMNVFGLQTFCVVTGASKGFGQTLAVRFASKFPKDSVLVLIARSIEGLEKTRAIIEENSPHVTVLTFPLDLGLAGRDVLDKLLGAALDRLNRDVSSFDQAVIVHNAASLGDVSKLFNEQNNVDDLQKYWYLNMTSFSILNHVFLKYFSTQAVKQRLVIGISSICALQPFKSWSLYCAGKAARDMLLRTMALEDSSVRVLNYAPGPIDTEMQHIARTETADTELKNMFIEFKETSKLLTCDQSVDRLVPLLEKNTFDSGAHIDYYDL